MNDPDPIAAYVDQAAPLMGLSLTPDERAGVIQHLGTMFAVARLVMEFPLPDDADAAPVFSAAECPGGGRA